MGSMNANDVAVFLKDHMPEGVKVDDNKIAMTSMMVLNTAQEVLGLAQNKSDSLANLPAANKTTGRNV